MIAGGEEDDQRRPAGEVARLQMALEKKAQHHQRHRDDAAVGEHVGQVERALGHILLGLFLPAVLEIRTECGGQLADSIGQIENRARAGDSNLSAKDRLCAQFARECK